MSDIIYAIKMLGVTFLIVLLMQVQVGQKPIEDHLLGWAKASVAVDYLQSTVDAGVAMTRVGYKKADVGIRALLARMSRKGAKQERGINIDLKRYNEGDEDEEESPLPKAKLKNQKME